MSGPTLAQRVRLTIELQMGRQTVRDDERLREDLDMDSFALMSLVTVLEEDHDVQISEDDAATLTTVGDVVALVTARVTG